nr:hypothetical protein [Tanacetum cinerariifolium]
MANPNPEDPNIPNVDVHEEDPYHLLDFDEEEDPEMDIEEPEEDTVEEPEPLAGHGDQFDAHPNPQPGNMNGWVDDHDDVEEEDDEKEDVGIEEDDDAKIIFPYEVQGDQTPPPEDESCDSEFEAEEADDELEVEEAGVEPEAEEADVELEAGELDGALEATIRTGSQSGLAPWALRHDLEVLRRQERIREAESGTSTTEIALLGSKARIRKMEREILHHDLSGVEETLGNVVERLKVLESEENATLKKKLADKEMLLDFMVRKGVVPKPPSDDEGFERPRKMPKKSDGDEGPSDPRGPLMIMPPKAMSKARMREIIRDQFATFMNEFMANMNNEAGGSGGAGGSSGAGGSGGTGGNAGGRNAGRTGVRGAGPTVPELTGCTYVTFTSVIHFLSMEPKAQMVEPEAVKVEQYLWGLTKSIRGDVTSSHPATINDAVRVAYQLVGQLIQDKADEATEGEKRKGEGDRGGRGDNRCKHNCRQNQRRGNARAMTNVAPNNNETCQKCKNRRHAGDYWKCTKCGKLGHKTERCRIPEMSFYNCNEKGYENKDCPKLGRNGQGGNNRGGAYQLGAVNAQEDPKVVTGT